MAASGAVAIFICDRTLCCWPNDRLACIPWAGASLWPALCAAARSSDPSWDPQGFSTGCQPAAPAAGPSLELASLASRAVDSEVGVTAKS